MGKACSPNRANPYLARPPTPRHTWFPAFRLCSVRPAAHNIKSPAMRSLAHPYPARLSSSAALRMAVVLCGLKYRLPPPAVVASRCWMGNPSSPCSPVPFCCRPAVPLRPTVCIPAMRSLARPFPSILSAATEAFPALFCPARSHEKWENTKFTRKMLDNAPAI